MDQKIEQVKKKTKRVTIKLLVVVALFLLTLFIFGMITDEIVLEHESNFDTFIFKKLALLDSPSLTKVMLTFTFFGSTYFLLPCYILLTLYYLFLKKNSSLTINVCAIGLSSTALLFLIKDIFKRPRPLDPLIDRVAGFSFPSGHSFSAFTFFGLLVYILWDTEINQALKIILSITFCTLAICIATSRVYLHVHYASDVVAGFCLSMIWLIISLSVLHKIDLKMKRNNQIA